MATQAGYRHEAMLWSGEDEFVDGCAPFIREGLEQGEPVMVATTGEREALLVAALGAQAGSVRFVDMEALGANPARIIPAWAEFLRTADGSPARGIGEPIWAGRSDVEIAECHLHESLLNLAVPSETPFWLRCPYDAGRLPVPVLREAERTHPIVTAGEHPVPRTHAYAGAELARDSFSTSLPDPGSVDLSLDFGERELRGVRSEVSAVARREGVGADRAADLGLAAHELAANSILHGGGRGELLMWRVAGALVCQISDGGTVADPLAGRLESTLEASSGRGLWMVNHLCDLVQLRSSGSGTTVRLYTYL